MIIEKIECKNFRNLENLSVSFSDKINVIVGMNGQGKTNLLESIYYLSTTRSFRTSNDSDLIMYDSNISRIDCLMVDDYHKKSLRCLIHENGKSCFISKNPISKTSEFIGNLNAVLFVPSDVDIFSSSPRNRRKMMDIEIGKVDNLYSLYLNKYNTLMKDRNSFFKLGKDDNNLLDILEQQMVDYQTKIITKRIEFIKMINEEMNKYYKIISEDNANIYCKYKSISEKINYLNKDEFLQVLKDSRDRDRILKSTSLGIHRDDLEFMMNDKYLDSIASQGQRRMVVLSLKFVFIEFVLYKKNKYPILLLDDVLSELDLNKKKNLFSVIPKEVQTILTTTDIDELINDIRLNINVLKISEGKLITQED